MNEITRDNAPAVPVLPLVFKMWDDIESVIEGHRKGVTTLNEVQDLLKAQALYLITQAASDTSAALTDYFTGTSN